MNIIEKSKEYAKGKALEAISTAIEQAYEAGYNDGLRHRENQLLESMEEDVEYKDLALPSGTLWSSTYIEDEKFKTKFLPYLKASKLSLPTKEQFEELFSNCAIETSPVIIKHGIRITGVNGQEIKLSYVDIDELNELLERNEYIAFWLKDDEGKPEKEIARVNSSRKIIETKFFMGYKLPVMLVKSKE